MRIFENANYEFIGTRRKAYVFSAVALALSVAAMLIFELTTGSWVNYGVDFTGGTILQVEFNAPTEIGDLREELEGDFAGIQITRFGAENEYLIRTPEFTQEGVNVSEAVVADLDAAYGEDAYELVRTEAVGPQVGSELQLRALLALALAFGATLLYLAFRFEWRFGTAAVISVVHDVLITLGFIAIFRLEVAVTTVAAVLTVIGYSLNDTIVIFDRIRENLKASGRKESSASIYNRSINETLPRTVMTGGATFATLLSLAVFTDGIIRDFSLILILGTLIGTYSSIYVATPALLEIEERTGEPPREGTRSRSAAPAGV